MATKRKNKIPDSPPNDFQFGSLVFYKSDVDAGDFSNPMRVLIAGAKTVNVVDSLEFRAEAKTVNKDMLVSGDLIRYVRRNVVEAVESFYLEDAEEQLTDLELKTLANLLERGVDEAHFVSFDKELNKFTLSCIRPETDEQLSCRIIREACAERKKKKEMLDLEARFVEEAKKIGIDKARELLSKT